MKKMILMILLIFFVGCGEKTSYESKNITLEKITNENQVYSIEDFKNIGFKINKEYDVSELKNAQGVWFGFWKNNLNKAIDYEIRIYQTQELAIDQGVIFVEEVIGENAVLKKSTSSWKEGIQDRRSRNISSMRGSESNSVRAKYMDYIIYGNTIILCAGLDSNYARQNCSDLANSLNK
ncbi:MAG: hypothetical protein CL764_05815 [Chloroflexi bacterium]|nr:hypothetical protein [Chloroflexota bacterium]|tara:strand:+ start:81 stop:617 length:537 start_codon:yes stop_codon:yes gene_type:complete